MGTRAPSTPVHRKRRCCRACGENRLQVFLSLGPTPLANSFLRSSEELAHESYFPLDVYFCEVCSLVQLVDVIDPEVLFRNYIYLTGISDTVAAHNSRYAHTIVDLMKLQSEDLVVEIGSNDGSLLRCFKEHGLKTLGIEPAANIAEKARANAIETVVRFFNVPCAVQLRESHGPAKVVIGNNVLGHVDDTQDFLRGCSEMIDHNGLIVIEVPYVRELVDRLEYDTIYHEHLSYYSVSALIHLCDAVDLSIVRMERVPVHGGSLRMYARSKLQGSEHAREVLSLAEEERALGLTKLACYEKFASHVERHRQRFCELLETLKKEGKTVAGYGAPAKGNTLLNFCGIDTRLIPYTVDKSPMKVGLLTPGTHIPVLPVSTLLERQPDYVVILAWNFADEIMGQQQEYHDRGGRFIIPIPDPKVV